MLTSNGSAWTSAAPTVPTTLGAIGTYAMLADYTGIADDPGDTNIAANLRYASAGGTTTTVVAVPTGSTWRCMGFTTGATSGGNMVSLYLRIS